MLYLVSTPIGNLSDITLRAIEVLKQSDLILCEDTRTSSVLMKHYAIETPVKSYHKFNETKLESFLIDKIKNGKTLALISDAGTPCISDPGQKLVSKCLEEKLPVISIPGACAVIAALTSSGLITNRFQFIGFLPKKQQKLKTVLLDLLSYKGTSICYESPHRIKKVLFFLNQLDPNRKIVTARELTKKYEEVQQGRAEDLLKLWSDKECKGEFVLLISESSAPSTVAVTPESIEIQVTQTQENLKVTKKEAIEIVAKKLGIPKKIVYKSTLSKLPTP